MAKKRKTREQKKLADSRHNFSHTMVSQVNADGKISLHTKPIQSGKILISAEQKPKHNTSVNEYPFLIKDLSKTAILTTAILSFQIMLFILLINHTLIIPGLSY